MELEWLLRSAYESISALIPIPSFFRLRLGLPAAERSWYKVTMKPSLTASLVLTLTLLSVSPGQGEETSTPAAPLDGTLFTSYFFDSTHTIPTWIVCGSTQNTSGCYGAGTLGPFGKVGAMLEGNPRTDLGTSTVTREIYVLDVASGTNQDEVVLDVYTKTDVITPDFDTVTVTLSQAITLPLTGGTSAKGFMAANRRFLLVGTSQSALAIELDKRTFATTQFGAYSSNLSSITADQYGYLTADFGDSEFFQLGPDGRSIQGGGGVWFMLNTIQGVPAKFP